MAGAISGRDDLSASGERGVHAATVFSALSMAGLGWALAVGDLTYRYVASWTSSAVPLLYRVGAVWAGPAGALLVWAFVLGVGASLAAVTLPRGSVLRAWTGALLALLLFAVLALTSFDVNPFLRLPFPPDDGRGLPLEWMRPVALMQMKVGYAAMTLIAVPSVMMVMGALGTAPWRDTVRRWALACWALVGSAMLLDWRRRYGDGFWAGDWQWAPVHDGTAFAFAGATLLVLAAGRRWRADATLVTGFAAFTLALGGLSLRRVGGWDGVHDFAASAAGRAIAWLALAAVAALVVTAWRSLRADTGLAARALRVSHAALLLAAAALVATSFARRTDVGVREGEQARVTDVFGTPWGLSLESVSRVGRGDVVSSVLAVRAAVDGKARGYVTAEVRTLFSRVNGQPVDQLDVAGISAGLVQDLRVDAVEANTDDAVLTVRFIPGATWLWIAGLAAALSALVAAFVAALAPRSKAAGENGQREVQLSAPPPVAAPPEPPADA